MCINEDRKELYSTNETLLDGTPCSYDNQDNICVQVNNILIVTDIKLLGKYF